MGNTFNSCTVLGLTVQTHTVKVTGVLLGLQLRYEFSLLPQETVPVQTKEEHVHLHLCGSTYGDRKDRRKTGLTRLSS